MNFITENIDSEIILKDEKIEHNNTLNEYLEFADDSDDIDDIKTAHDNFISINGVIEGSLEKGIPLDENTAKITKIATESIISRLNNRIDKKSYISLENFKDKRTSFYQTKITSESIAQHIVSFVKAILDSIQNLWNKIKSFFSKLFSRKDNIKSGLKNSLFELDKLDIKNLPGSQYLNSGELQVSKEDVELDPLMKRIPFGIKGICDYETTKGIILDTKTLIQGCREISTHIVKCLRSASSHNDYNKLTTDVENLVKEIKSRVSRLRLKYKRIDGPSEILNYGYLVDNQICIIVEHLNKSHLGDEVKLFNIDVTITKDKVISFKPALLKKHEMADIGKLAIELIDVSKELDRLLPGLDTVLTENIKYFNNKMVNITESEYKASKHSIELIKDLFKYVSHNYPKLSYDANKIGIDVGYYIKDCVAVYKQKTT